jgi:RecA/RadA recombinase
MFIWISRNFVVGNYPNSRRITMPITFKGDVPGSTERESTGSYSLDMALRDQDNNVGWPMQSLVEVYGPKSIGKTSLCLWLAGRIAKARKKSITILDFEIQNRHTVEGILTNAGYSGDVNYIQNVGKERSEETLARFTDAMFDKQGKTMTYANPDIGILDSLGGFRPTAELEGDIGDANMGLKPRELGQLTGRLIRALQLAEKPNTIFMTNHLHPNIGFLKFGSSTTGGETRKYLSHVRIDMKKGLFAKSFVDFGEHWLVKGKIDNNRFGFSQTDFQLYIIGGQGVHVGLSAVWDCIAYGLAFPSTQKFTETTTISLDGKSFGKFGAMVEKRNKDKEFFTPFINKLQAEGLTQSQEFEDDGTETVEEDIPTKTKKKKK